MTRTYAHRSLLVLVLMVGPGVAFVSAGEPAGSPSQESLEAATATQPDQLDKPKVSSSHHQCFQQTRFPPRRAKKKSAPSSSSSQAGPQERSG